MGKANGLYGKSLKKDDDNSLTEQTYRILRREILRGRWSEGERMPSFNDLFSTTRLSRYPLDNALNRLEEEKFIKKIRKKGVFLISMRPEGVILGKIGIIVDRYSAGTENSNLTRAVTNGFGFWYIPTLQRYIEELGFSTEILPLDRQGIPAEEFDGIISFAPIKETRKLGLNGNMPIIFLGVEDVLSSPCVTGNPNRAIYELTNLLIKAGHSDIAVFAGDIRNSFFLDITRDGFQMALADAGLKPPATDFFSSDKIKTSDMLGIKSFLDENKNATAVLTLNVSSSHKIVEYADLVGIRIPENLSLVSLQVGKLRGKETDGITGAGYDWNAIMGTCTDILLDKLKLDVSKLSRIQYNPVIMEGLTVGAPRKEKFLKN
ncbi:MAG: GntR family transcriptional regulator [Lentisphaerota bacterium]